MSDAHRSTVLRAALPEILFIEDLEKVLQVGRSAARRAVVRGDCGPYTRIGRRICVRRDALMAALAARERATSSRPHLALLSGHGVQAGDGGDK